MLEKKLTVFSTYAIDTILNEDGTILRKQTGGPAFYLSKVLRSSMTPVTLETGSKARINIQLNKSGEVGEVLRVPKTKKIQFSKVDSPYLIISTVFSEYELEELPKYQGKVFLDVQGYVRKRGRLGEKKPWQPNKEILNNIYCLKGTKEEIQKVPPAYIQKQKKKILIVTKGEQGCDIYGSGKCYKIKPIQVIKSRDTIGAGDTFFAHFVSHFIETKRVHASAQYATQKALDFLLSKNNA